MTKIYLDIMLHGRFVCQMPYTKRGRVRLVDGKKIELHDTRDILDYVYSQRPSLENKGITISFSNQKVLHL